MSYLPVGLIAIAFLVATALANESSPKDTNIDYSGFKPIKRQAVYNVPPSGGANQYAPQQEVSPEFLNYLQQLSEQQAVPQAHQASQQQPQLLPARGPPQQIFQPQPQQAFPAYRVAPAPAPNVPRLSPQAEEQRRLQQEYADRPLREQQQRALQQLFQPAPPAYRTLPVYAPQPQPQIQAQPQLQHQIQVPQPQIPQAPQYSPEELRALAEQQYLAYEQAQFVEQPIAIHQHQPQRQPQPQPQHQPQHQPQIQAPIPKYSYSQIQFGSPPTSSQKIRSQPQPQPSQTLFYSQQPEYYPSEQQTPTQPQSPEQYLIETSKPQQSDEQRIVAIPRPKQQLQQHAHQSIYYKPQQQFQQPKYVDDNAVRSTTAAPSRSSIFVTKSGQDSKPLYTLGETLQQTFSGSNQIRLPDTRGGSGHPLSQTELSSLLQAGFQVSTPPDSRRNLLSGPSYLRAVAAKRHNKRVPSPVPLSDDERRTLAQQGIRNLYKVESSESQNSPVTYVLALDNNLKQKNGQNSQHVYNGHNGHRNS